MNTFTLCVLHAAGRLRNGAQNLQAVCKAAVDDVMRQGLVVEDEELMRNLVAQAFKTLHS